MYYRGEVLRPPLRLLSLNLYAVLNGLDEISLLLENCSYLILDLLEHDKLLCEAVQDFLLLGFCRTVVIVAGADAQHGAVQLMFAVKLVENDTELVDPCVIKDGIHELEDGNLLALDLLEEGQRVGCELLGLHDLFDGQITADSEC